VIHPVGPRHLSVKLGLVLFLAVGCALAIVYVAALPRLESRLVNAKLRELERSAETVSGSLAATNRLLYQDAADLLGSSFNVRVVVYDRLTERALRPIADSSGLRSTDVQRDEIALRAAASRMPASGRTERGDAEYAEVATPVGSDTVVLLSAPLRDALSTVRLVRRTLLIAGSVALLVAWLAGFLAAWSISRRVGQLERAEMRVELFCRHEQWNHPLVKTIEQTLADNAESQLIPPVSRSRLRDQLVQDAQQLLEMRPDKVFDNEPQGRSAKAA